MKARGIFGRTIVRGFTAVALTLAISLSPLLSSRVSAAAPDTQLDTYPLEEPSIDNTPTFTFSSPDDPLAVFECYMDSDQPVPCTSPYTSQPLNNGSHRFTVQAVNTGQEVDPTPAYHMWSVGAFDGGDGSRDNPYTISSCLQLQAMHADLAASYELASDVDCQGYTGFLPIGTEADPFTGNFDGQYYTIRNLNITTGRADDSYIGLFSSAGVGMMPGDDSEIQNLAIEDSSFSGTAYVGSVAGYLGGNLTNVQVSNVSITATGNKAGGLAGSFGGSQVQTSSFTGTISSTGAQVGGLAGHMVGPTSITDSYANTNLGGDTDVAGLVGYADSGTQVVSNSYAITNFTTLTGSRSAFIGTITQEVIQSNNFAVSNILGSMANGDVYKNNTTYGPLDNWDFDTVWNTTSEYPCLRWEAACPIATYSDYNGDGQDDRYQSNISFYISPITGKRVLIDVGSNCDITTDDITSESSLGAQDSGFDYSHGLFDFAGDCNDVGFTTTVKLYYYGETNTNLTVRKFNPNNNSFFTINDATKTPTTIGGNSVLVVSFQITDGGSLDMDGQVDGEFTDPVGLGASVVAVPNTGFARGER